jgi:hypothetical protein
MAGSQYSSSRAYTVIPAQAGIYLTQFEFENCQPTQGFSWNSALPD